MVETKNHNKLSFSKHLCEGAEEINADMESSSVDYGTNAASKTQGITLGQMQRRVQPRPKTDSHEVVVPESSFTADIGNEHASAKVNEM